VLKRSCNASNRSSDPSHGSGSSIRSTISPLFVSCAIISIMPTRSSVFVPRCSSICCLRSKQVALHLEALAEIKLAADGIVDEKIFRAFAFDAAVKNQIGAVYNRQRLANIVVGNHDGQP